MRWPVVALGDVAQFVRGITYKPADVSVADDANAIPCMRTKNIQADLEDDDLVYIPATLAKPEKRLRQGDILVSSANSWNLVGKCSWVPELSYDATFGGFTSVLRTTDKQLSARYLYRWFSTERVQALARSFGQQTTNIANLNHARCLTLEIPLPPLAEQRRIAAILDKADALRRKRQRAIESLDSLTQSIVTEKLLGGHKITFGDLILGGPTNGLYKPSSAYGSGAPILRIGNFYDGKITDLTELRRLDVSDDEIKRFGLTVGDIIINRVNSLEYLGKSALVEHLGEPTVYESNMMRLTVDSNRLLPEVCISLLQTADVKRQILGKAKNAVNQSSINQGDVRSLELPLPSMDAQRAFLELTHATGVTRAALCQSGLATSALFASLQSRAFAGEL